MRRGEAAAEAGKKPPKFSAALHLTSLRGDLPILRRDPLGLAAHDDDQLVA
ncbi:MAG: hypothetical protein ACRDRX_21560 [Pseudonocardiaceae bacterium]